MVCVDCGKKHLTPSKQDSDVVYGDDGNVYKTFIADGIPEVPKHLRLDQVLVSKEDLEDMITDLNYAKSMRYRGKYLSEQTEKPLTI
jgi:hypothetical protein